MEDTLRTVPKNKIFRFKFNNDFSIILNEFAKLHRYDDRVTFKNAWDTWCDENNKAITKESRRLINMDYQGDVLTKMYKSARYYYRKKSDQKKKPKIRREYVSISSNILEDMDTIINDNNINEPPADLFLLFCKRYSDDLVIEMTELFSNTELTKEEILQKIKKTFKNRYFNIKKNI